MRIFDLDRIAEDAAFPSQLGDGNLSGWENSLDRYVEANRECLGFNTDFMYEVRSAAGVVPVRAGDGASDHDARPTGSGVKGAPRRAGVSGMLNDSELKSIGKGHRLRADAADAWLALMEKARSEGVQIRITDSYRSYEAQVDVYRRKPNLAAKPGTSNHGWGLALDLDVGGFSGRVYKWLAKNGPDFGWVNPDWAHDGKGKEEPWHWEFVAGSKAL